MFIYQNSLLHVVAHMKKKLVFAVLALSVVIIAAIWFYNQQNAVNRQAVFKTNQILTAQIDSLNRFNQQKADSLKRFNPDPLLTIYEGLQRADELTGYIEYTKKVIAEKSHHDLLQSADSLLFSEPVSKNVSAVFHGSDRKDYNAEGLKKQVNRFRIFSEMYTGVSTEELTRLTNEVIAEDFCTNEGYACYSKVIVSLNRLILAVEKHKTRLLTDELDE